MGRLKLFLSNFLVYGLGGVIGKVIPLIMLPIITRLMPDTAYFGLNDISVMVVSFATYLGIMGMYDAMFRLFFEQDSEDYKKSICSSALAFTICMSLFIFALMMMLREKLSILFFGSQRYENLLILSAVSALIGTTNSIVSAPTRFLNRRKVFLATNILSPLISYGISVPLLLRGWYIVALPLASVASVLFVEVFFLIINRKWFEIKSIDIKQIKQMLAIALPLVPNFLIYWIFNSADRLMITQILGSSYTGIYAIGSKFGSISQLIYTAFAGGWQYFAFSMMKEHDQVQLNSRVFEYLLVITTGASILMMTFSEILFEILFEGNYVKGAIVVPYLFTAPLLLMLYQVGGNQFLIIKKTWPNMFILLIGAVVNVVLNWILIPQYGVEGAAIATLSGYALSVGICMVVLKKMRLFIFTKRAVAVWVVLMIYFVGWRLFLIDNFLLSFGMTVIVFVGLIFAYSNDIILLVYNLKRIMKAGKADVV